MDPQRWQHLSPLLDVLLELEPRARAARLQALRAQDPEAGADLDRLLALEAREDQRLDRPLHDASAAPLEMGERVGPYRLESMLGQGGMGMVWLASRADGLYQRRVALKLLRPGLADPGLRLRFTREREILARLAHPNIARLLDAGITEQGQPYLALDYVQGVPITEHCHSTGLPVEERIALFLQVCEAVSHAHANLVVHRDLKPSNILVTAEGQVRLLDFGIAKLLDDAEPLAAQSHTEARAFTLHYAAPEQVRGEPVTTRTDVYSLGVVLYELLAETKPYRLRRQTDAEWEQAILAVEPLKPSVASLRGTEGGREQGAARRHARRLRGDLDTIALKALAKAPGERYPSVEALSTDLCRHLQGRPIAARPQSFAYRIGKYAVRQRWALGAGTLAIGLLVAAMAASVWQGRQAVREAARAQALQDFVIGLFDNAGAAQQGTIFDARALLLAGERRGERELANQPLALAELLGVIARLRIGLGDYAPALALLERQEALLSRLRSVPPGLLLEAATQRGRTLRLLDRPRECLQVMAAAEPLALRVSTRLPVQEADFLSQYGRCHRLVGDHARARPLYLRSLALRRSLREPGGVAENLYDLALVDSDLGRTDAALQGFDQALAHLRQGLDVPHPLAAEIQTSRARVFRARGATDAAMVALRDALATASEVHGSAHPSTLSIRRQLVAMHVDAGEFALADRQIGPLLRATLQSLGPRHREAAMAWNTRGVIAWELGRLEQALEDTARAVDIWRGPDGASNLHGGLFVRGMVLHAAGHHRPALTALRQSRALRIAQFGASHALVGETDRMIGEVLAALGEPARAAGYFDRAVKLTRVGYGEGHPRSLDAALSQARHLARTGQLAAALPRLRALASQPGSGSEIPKVRWSARAYAAEARCLAGERAQGRFELEILLRELDRARPDGGALVREVRSIRDACAG